MIDNRFGRGVIYTAISGQKDSLTDPSHIIQDVDYICFTDNESHTNNTIWIITRFEDIPSIAGDNVRIAKHVKILPHRYLRNYDWSLWVDGNIRIDGDLSSLIESGLERSSFSAFNHHRRTCLFDEARACIDMEKDNKDIIEKQISKYRSLGVPENLGLSAAMIMLRKHNEVDIVNLMQDWWNEIRYFSRRDQISLSFVCWKNGFNINPLGSSQADWRTVKEFRRVRHRN